MSNKKMKKKTIDAMNSMFAAPGFCALMVVLGVYYSK
jgi:hypothetical protein